MQIVQKLAEAKRVKEVERLLSLAIYSAYADSLAGVHPLEIFNSLSTGFGQLSLEFKKITAKVHRGMPLQLALKTSNINSTQFRSLLSELSALDKGIAGSGELKKLAREVSSTQRAELKSHASKSNLLGLFLVALGAVIPALFAAISLLGSVIGFAISPAQVWLAFIILFPLMSALLLLYADYVSPGVAS